MPGDRKARRRGVLLVLLATLLWSTAGVYARLLQHLDLWTVMGWRALLHAPRLQRYRALYRAEKEARLGAPLVGAPPR